ncbi:MAG: hypothetical protein K8R13_03150 [Methanococcoides sp.]|nr:hypothetical protein [Methanococcoides sp.]
MPRTRIAAGLTDPAYAGFRTIAKQAVVTVAVIVTGLALDKEKDGAQSAPVVICILPADEDDMLSFTQFCGIDSGFNSFYCIVEASIQWGHGDCYRRRICKNKFTQRDFTTYYGSLREMRSNMEVICYLFVT